MCDKNDPYDKVMKEITAIVNSENWNFIHFSLETIVDRLEKSATAVSGEDDILRQLFVMKSLLIDHQDKMKKIKTKAERLYQKANDMKYKQFSAAETEDVKKNFLKLFEKFLLYRAKQREMFLYDKETIPIDTSDFYKIMDSLLDELKTLKRIEKNQKVADVLQEIKKRFYAVSNTDTSKQFVKKLIGDANELKEKMESHKLDQFFPDMHKELTDLTVKLARANSNTNKQIALESVTGVLSVGSAVASSVIGGIAIASAVGTAANSSASAASTTARLASSTATRVAVGASEASSLAGTTVSKTAQASLIISAKSAELASSGTKAVATAVEVGKGVSAAGGAITEIVNVVKVTSDSVETKANETASETTSTEPQCEMKSDDDDVFFENFKNRKTLEFQSVAEALRLHRIIMKRKDGNDDYQAKTVA